MSVREVLARYTTDAISTCALGIEANSLSNPKSEVRDQMRKIFDFSFKKGFKAFLMFFEPQIFKFFKMKFLEDKTSNFFRETVWETVKFRYVTEWSINQYDATAQVESLPLPLYSADFQMILKS